MVYIESKSFDPYYNLALEEYVFESLDRSKEYFMLWQNLNTIVVGKYQNTYEEINRRYTEEHGISVARRLSGGGAVYHDKGNLNFTFIVSKNSNPDFNFKVFIEPVVKTLKVFGIDAEFNGRNDITINGMKFSGNSQYSRHNRIMHHGCIMLDSNLTTVADALNVNPHKFDSKSVKSIHSRVTTINANAALPITIDAFKEGLKQSVFESADIAYYSLSAHDESQIQKLRDEKYATWEWNWGRSPKCSVKKERKFPAGLVSVYMSIENGRITEINFYGDFFGNENISDLEALLIGSKIDSSLLLLLQKANLERYMDKITPCDLYSLLTE